MFAGMFWGWFSAAASNYNGFVLGLIAELADEYEIHSNREKTSDIMVLHLRERKF